MRHRDSLGNDPLTRTGVHRQPQYTAHGYSPMNRYRWGVERVDPSAIFLPVDGIDSDPSPTQRVHHGLCSVVDGKFLENRGDVILDGMLADEERSPDLLVAISLANLLEDLDFPGRKRGEQGLNFLGRVIPNSIELLQDLGCDGWANEKRLVDDVFAAPHPPNR